MTDQQKHAHICAIKDAFWRVWQALLKLPRLMAERDKHKDSDAHLMAYLDTLPYPELEDGQTAQEKFEAARAVYGKYSAAVREIADRQGGVKDAFLEYLRAADEVRELSKESYLWLPKLAAETHGLGEVRTWTGELIRALAWGICDGPSTTEIPDVEKHSRTAGNYWGMLAPLSDFTAPKSKADNPSKLDVAGEVADPSQVVKADSITLLIEPQTDTEGEEEDRLNLAAESSLDRETRERLALAQLLITGPVLLQIAKKTGIPRSTLRGFPLFMEKYEAMRGDAQARRDSRRGGRDRGDDYFADERDKS